MRPSSTELTIAILVISLLVATGWTNIKTRNKQTANPHAEGLCIAVSHPHRGDGLIFPARHGDIMELAVTHLGVPIDCKNVPIKNFRQSGALVVLKEVQGDCRLQRIGPLPPALGFLCGERMDLNRAKEEDLILLPGIGQSRARQIIELRREKGPFTSVEDLTQIRGIGTKTAEKVADWVQW